MPGYQAPADTVAMSQEIMAVLIGACRKADIPSAETPFGSHLDNHRHWAPDPTAPTAILRQAMTFWTRLHGVLSLELAGHFTGMDIDVALLYADEVDSLLR